MTGGESCGTPSMYKSNTRSIIHTCRFGYLWAADLHYLVSPPVCLATCCVLLTVCLATNVVESLIAKPLDVSY